MSENNSIVSKRNRISNYLKLEIIKQCKYKHSFTTIAKQLNVDTMTVINTFMEHFTFDRKELTEIICVDEFSANIDEDNKYACIIGDPVKKEIIDILPSRHQEYLERYLANIPLEERLMVKIVNIDMWEAYKVVFTNYCWNAKIAVYPFHWIKLATDNFHKLRRIVEDELNKLIKKLEETKIPEMISIAKTFRHWFTEICNSFITYGPYNKKVSNAFIEGKNRLCKEIKAFSCGLENFAIYRARILYISSNGNYVFKKGDNKRKLYKKNRKRVVNSTLLNSIAFFKTLYNYIEPHL